MRRDECEPMMFQSTTTPQNPQNISEYEFRINKQIAELYQNINKLDSDENLLKIVNLCNLVHLLTHMMMDCKRASESREYFEDIYNRYMELNKKHQRKYTSSMLQQLIELFNSLKSHISGLLYNNIIEASQSLNEFSTENSVQNKICIEVYAILEILNIDDNQNEVGRIQCQADVIRNKILPILDNSGRTYMASIKTKFNNISHP